MRGGHLHRRDRQPLSRDEVRREVLIRFSIPLGNADYGIESQNEVVIT
jgi:hypothetical protein